MSERELAWESTYQYQCRAGKIAQHSGSLGRSRAVALANVWANYHFLGCSYPAPVLAAIKHWEPPPKDENYEEKLAAVQQSEQDAMFDPDLVNPHISLKLLKLKLYRGTGAVEEPALCLFYNSCQRSRIPCEFREVQARTKGSHRAALYINDIHVSDGEEKSFKEAKHVCAENALKYLKKKGMSVISPAEIDEDAISQVSKNSLSTRGSEDLQKINEDNVGSKMLKMMGWTGDTGLGKDGQGIKDPVSSAGQTNRGGLGSQNSEFAICRQTVQEQLLSFMRDSTVMKLEFTNELDNLERKLIHQLSERYGLKHKSKGSGANRRLMVWKEEDTTVEDLMNEPVVAFEETEGMELEGGLGFVDDQCDTSDHMTTLAIQPGARRRSDHRTRGGRGNELFLVDGERDILATNTGKRKTKTGGNLPKVSKSEAPPRDLRRVINKKQDRTITRTVHCEERQDPFREGYIDPYLANPRRDTHHPGHTFTDPRNQNRTHVPCPGQFYQQPNGFDETYLRGHDQRIRQGNEFSEPNQRAGDQRGGDPRVPGQRSRDPRTNHSSGFGIYRSMRRSNHDRF